MLGGVSLANKCILLFGAAVVLIVTAALTVAWFRMNAIIDREELETSRQLVLAWDRSRAGPGPGDTVKLPDGATLSRHRPERVGVDRWADPFLGRAWDVLADRPPNDEYTEASWEGGTRVYRLAIRAPADRAESARNGRPGEGTEAGEPARPVALLTLTRPSTLATRGVVENTIYLVSVGCCVLGLAVLVFYLITTRLILGPVRLLRDTAEQVRQGNLETRSDIRTGDEFEELAITFNQMLEALQGSQNQLRAINASLDLKVSELAERNLALFEANKIKGEFLASVSHELRTPLNSIIGFTELLLEFAEREAEAGDDSSRLAKRQRYLENILSSGRGLLEMINGLLEIARVEAGRSELTIQSMDLGSAGEALVALMRPVADKRGVELRLELGADVPAIETDAKRFQQIVFNLLSNAIKFSAPGAEHERRGAADPGLARPAIVTLRIERLPGSSPARVRVSVLDTGPGIAPEDQARIFEKFTQLDTGYDRKHTGAGLGLAIAKELTTLLQGEIQVESEVGRGSMFSVILPERLDTVRAAEMKLEMAFRGSLAGRDGPSA